MKTIFKLMILIVGSLTVTAQAQWWDAEPEPGFDPPPPSSSPSVDFGTYNVGNVILSEGILCPGCETEDDFQQAARTGCFDGYREVSGGIANILVWNPTGNSPGIVPSTGQHATEDDPCVYNMEVRGNWRSDGKVTVTVCNEDGRCLLVTHQFIPECPGVGARIGNGTISATVDGCLLFSTGIEGLCTTVRREDLTETDPNCITTVTDRGKLPPPLPAIPGLDTIAAGDIPNQNPVHPPHGYHINPHVAAECIGAGSNFCVLFGVDVCGNPP